MPDQATGVDTAPDEYAQLSQAHVPLEQAADVFTSKDATGRTPIVILTKRHSRIQSIFIILAVAAVALGILADPLLHTGNWLPYAVALGLIVIGFGIYRSLYVRIPEGVTGLRTQGGKYVGLVDSGSHILPPWATVTHLVTRREIPYEVPVIDAPTKDNVRATLDALITFNISDPYRFVYSISASDFDHVFQAACQYALRALVRQITADEVNDLIQMDTAALRTALSKDVEPYGVSITRTTITYARPPEDFMRSQEARQLAVLQREEQAEQQLLAERRLAAEQALELKKIIAQVQREREQLQAQMQEAQMHCQVAEVEARALDLRLGGLEAALRRYPLAAQWETQTAELDVARALAGNSRSVLQIGGADDIVRAFTVRDFLAQPGATHPETPTEVKADSDAQA